MRNQMNIAVVNKSTNVSHEDAHLWTEACAKQITRDVAPAWGCYTAHIGFTDDDHRLSDKWYRVVLLDDADTANALGYHWETPEGLPYGRVFTKISAQYGTVSSVLSHEIIELFLDPDCNRYAIDTETNTLYAVEGCDAVEGDSYNIDGVEVSNFILPAWFDRTHRAGDHFDFLQKLSAPFTMTRGGYLIYMQGNEEKQQFGFKLGPDVPKWKYELKWHPAARTVKKLTQLQNEEK